MANFANINENNEVVNVIVIEDQYENDGQNYINNVLGLSGEWIQTSYTNSIRGNFASKKSIYDRENDVFYSQQPFPSWVLNNEWQWEAPIPYPTTDTLLGWDEDTLSWIEILIEE